MSGGSHGRLKSFKRLALRRNMSVLDNLSDGKRYEAAHDPFLFDAKSKFCEFVSIGIFVTRHA
jgi:hypothetical protein